MTKCAEEIKLDVHDLFFTKDGKFFVRKNISPKHGEDEMVFVEVNRKEYEKNVKRLAEEIVERSGLTPVQVVTQALRYIPLGELKKLEKNLKRKKPITIERGCVDLKCGGVEIPIC